MFDADGKEKRSENRASRGFFFGLAAATALKSRSEMLITAPRIVILGQGVKVFDSLELEVTVVQNLK